MQLANAVAASYIDYVGQLKADSENPLVTGLQHESTQLTQQIKNLQFEIATVTDRLASEAAGSSQGQQDTELLG